LLHKRRSKWLLSLVAGSVLVSMLAVVLAAGLGRRLPVGPVISFAAIREDHSAIYALDVNRDLAVRLTKAVAISYNPVWSPDGQQLAFVARPLVIVTTRSGQQVQQVQPNTVGQSNSTRLDRDDEIYIMNADGGNVRRLTENNAKDSEPAWSPDGQRLAFVSLRDGNEEIYVTEVGSTEARRLTETRAADFAPAWSPDGRHIIFQSQRDGNTNIYIMDADGGDLRRLSQDNTFDIDPMWSPNGRNIVFTSWYEIYIMDMSGDAQRLRRLTDNTVLDEQPVWSPDGQHLAFAFEQDGNFEIYIMAIQDGSLRRLTRNSVDDRAPAWSPDGQYIAYVSARSGRFNYHVYMVHADGSSERQLTKSISFDSMPAWQPCAECGPAVEGIAVASGAGSALVAE
jgi:Tol biopolymer transport system component